MSSRRYFCLQTKNIMVSSCSRTKAASQAKYISILNIIQGEVDPTQVFILNSQTNLDKFLSTGDYLGVLFYLYLRMYLERLCVCGCERDAFYDCSISTYWKVNQVVT